MPDTLDEKPAGREPQAPEVPAVKPRRPKRKRSLKIDKEKVVSWVLSTHQTRLDDTQAQRDDDMEIEEQLKGWLPEKKWPYENCFSADTRILTLGGWRYIKDVQIGDAVFSKNPRTGQATYHRVTAVQKSYHEKMVAIKNKSVDLLVTPDHKILVENFKRKNGPSKTRPRTGWKFVQAKNLKKVANSWWYIPLVSTWKGVGVESDLVYGLPAKPLCEFLGWYIAEGWTYQSGTIGITQKRGAKADRIRRVIKNLGFKFSEALDASGMVRFLVSARSIPHWLRRELKNLGKCEAKRIPRFYLLLGRKYLDALFSGLIAGDGNIRKTKNGVYISYYTTSKQLADDVMELGQKLGYRVHCSIRNAIGVRSVINGSDVITKRIGYQIAFGIKWGARTDRLAISEVDYNDFAYCVTVPPHHTVYIERNGAACWSGQCSNVWIPLMVTAARRMAAALRNALKSMRPLVESRATQSRNSNKQEAIDRVLDHQFFNENCGEDFIDSLVNNYVQKRTVYVFTPYVREDQTVREIRVLDPLDSEVDHIPQLLILLKGQTIFTNAENATMRDKDGWVWDVDLRGESGEPEMALVEFFDREDGKLEAYITRKVRVFDGPAPQVLDSEDVVVSARSANLQPPNAANPLGAVWVDHIQKVQLDSIRRRMDDGTYDLLTEDDWANIKAGKSATGSGATEEEAKEERDRRAGEEITMAGNFPDRQQIVRYCRWDVNGDGYDEDVIFWILKDSRVLCKAAYLSELYPGAPVKRPIDSQSFFPDTNRVVGDSFVSALWPLQDMMQTAMNQHIDWGTLTNMPFGFYRASSGLKPEPIMLEPGVMNPLDDPQRDVFFPNFASRGETFNINTMTLLQSFAERLSMLPDTAFGRIPTGKSAAMRNVGTVTALMSQIDVRTEEVLRGIFNLLCRVYQMMHRLNQRYLPKEKEVRVFGQEAKGEEAYAVIGPEHINADADFTFKATMLNTNKQMVSQALQQTAALLLSPLAIQAGIVTGEQVYNLLVDFCKSQDQDPDRYVKRPPEAAGGPKILAEEAFSAIDAHQVPYGQPLEPPEEHLQKLIDYQQSLIYANFDPSQLAAFQQWIMSVKMLMMQQQQQQMMMQAAAQTMGGGQGGQGPGGVPGTISSDTGGPTPVNSGESIDESMVQ